MHDFTTFYQNGGIFMHFITLAGAVALAAVLMHVRSRKLGVEAPQLLRVADRVAASGVAIGVLGAVFGFIEVCGVVSMMPPGELDGVELLQLAARGCTIAPITFAWSLMCAIPIWIATTVRGE